MWREWNNFISYVWNLCTSQSVNERPRVWFDEFTKLFVSDVLSWLKVDPWHLPTSVLFMSGPIIRMLDCRLARPLGNRFVGLHSYTTGYVMDTTMPGIHIPTRGTCGFRFVYCNLDDVLVKLTFKLYCSTAISTIMAATIWEFSNETLMNLMLIT